MKPVLQAVLLLGLVTPSFAAVPDVNFDGATDKHESIGAYISEALQNSSMVSSVLEIEKTIIPLKTEMEGIPSMRLVEIKESGKEEIVHPIETPEGKVSYEFMPNSSLYWDFSCTGQATGQWKVCWSTDFRPSAAGHVHPPMGRLSYIDPQSTETPPALLPSEICRTSQVNTPVRVFFKAPVYSTFVYDTMSYTGKCSVVKNAETSLKVTAQNLIQLNQLQPEPYFDFKESEDQMAHPGNYFATPDTNAKIKRIAWEYYQQFKKKLTINDIGLVWGGRYNTYSPYNCWVHGDKHAHHRYGRQVDVRSYDIPQANRACFAEIACKYQVHPILEGTAPGSIPESDYSNISSFEADILDNTEHYHLNFTRPTDPVVYPADDARTRCSSFAPPEVSACPKPLRLTPF